jgi:hypothetical protein
MVGTEHLAKDEFMNLPFSARNDLQRFCNRASNKQMNSITNTVTNQEENGNKNQVK